VVHLKVVAEQGQAKPALSLKRAMTSPAIAAQPTQERHDVLLKIRLLLGGLLGESLADGWPDIRLGISRQTHHEQHARQETANDSAHEGVL
jgi:hypothetical protein